MNPFEPSAPAKPVRELRRHHFLVAGELNVLVKTEGQPDQVTITRLNAIITNDDEYVRASALGRAQVALQQHFWSYHGANPDQVSIADVTILSLIPLGFMKPSVFNDRSKEQMTHPGGVAPDAIVSDASSQ